MRKVKGPCGTQGEFPTSVAVPPLLVTTLTEHKPSSVKVSVTRGGTPTVAHHPWPRSQLGDFTCSDMPVSRGLGLKVKP